jgi:hypothetical protein
VVGEKLGRSFGGEAGAIGRGDDDALAERERAGREEAADDAEADSRILRSCPRSWASLKPAVWLARLWMTHAACYVAWLSVEVPGRGSQHLGTGKLARPKKRCESCLWWRRGARMRWSSRWMKSRWNQLRAVQQRAKGEWGDGIGGGRKSREMRRRKRW